MTYNCGWISSFVLFHTFSCFRFLFLATSMSVSYQGWGVVSRTRTLRHGACLSRQSVRQVLYTCTNSSACRSFVHAHMSLHTDVMSLRSASAAMFLKSRFVIVLVCTAGFSALSLSSMRWWSDRESGCTVTDVIKLSSVWLTTRSRICPVWCVGECTCWVRLYGSSRRRSGSDLSVSSKYGTVQAML